MRLLLIFDIDCSPVNSGVMPHQESAYDGFQTMTLEQTSDATTATLPSGMIHHQNIRGWASGKIVRAFRKGEIFPNVGGAAPLLCSKLFAKVKEVVYLLSRYIVVIGNDSR